MCSGMHARRYAAEGTDIYLTWGQTAATTTMRVVLPEDARAVGDAMRAYLTDFARTGTLAADAARRGTGARVAAAVAGS